MRALVTGGAGFIGSHLVDALVERGDSSRARAELGWTSATELDDGLRRTLAAVDA